MLALIQAIHIELKGIYGSPRMVKELRGRGFPASKPRVERLMRENNIRARHKRRYKVTTDSKHNLIKSGHLTSPTYGQMRPQGSSPQNIPAKAGYSYAKGWLYLVIVIDLFNREVVGWSLKPRMTADIVTDELTMA